MLCAVFGRVVQCCAVLGRVVLLLCSAQLVFCSTANVSSSRHLNHSLHPLATSPLDVGGDEM